MHLHESSADTSQVDSLASPETTEADLESSRRAVAEEWLARMVLGERPMFRVRWHWDGTAVEIAMDDLPGVHAFAPTRADVERAAHHRIAAELHVPADAFDVSVVDGD